MPDYKCRPHHQFEDYETSLREGPRGAAGGLGPQGALAHPFPWCPPASLPQTGFGILKLVKMKPDKNK